MKVPAGRYWLFAAATPLRGRAGVDRVANVRVRVGKPKLRVPLRKRQRRQPRLPRIPGLPAHAAFVNVKYPAVWIQHFSVSGLGERSGLDRGLFQMLVTDLQPPALPCKAVIVEREKLGWIIAEQLRSQGPAFDPSTRLPTDKMIAHNREVSGSLDVTGSTMTLTVHVKNVVTGATRSVTRTSAPDRFFELERSIVPEVARLICGDKPPGHYSGQASGSMSGASSGSSQTLSWNGDVRLKYTGDLLSENVGIVPQPGEYSRVQQGVDEPTYTLLASLPPGAGLTASTTGPAYCGGGTSFTFPLGGRVFLGLADGTSRRSTSSMLVGTSSFVIGPVTTKWAWSLAPEAE
jgi:hypothetical protein